MNRQRIHMDFSADQGFSLAEVMTVSMMLALILGAAYLALGAVNNVSNGMMARSAAQTQGQNALETMSREIRQAEVISDGSQNLYRTYPYMTSSSVSFFTDIDHDGYVERVTYMASGGWLNRTVARSNKTGPFPSDFGSDGPATKLCQVDPSDTTFFRYTDGANPPNVVTDQTRVTAVLIDLQTVAKSGDQSVTVNFPTAEVDVRAYQNQ